MMKKTTIFQIIFISILFLMTPFAVGPVTGDTIPVVPLSTGATIFNPTLIGNSSYYTVPSDFNGTNILYSGRNGALSYTSNSNNGITIGYGSGNAVASKTMPDTTTTPETRNIQNPLFKNEQIPVLVNITANNSQLITQNPIGLSLHMQRSLTFFFNESLTYYALINTTSPFFLDVNVINPSAQLTIDLSKTLYPAQGSFPLAKQLSIPVIPENFNLQAFKINQANHLNSIVTITPLPFNAKDFGISKVPAGNYYTGSVSQGQCYDIQKNPASNDYLKILDLKFFQFPVTAGNTYQIYYYHNNINDNFNQTYYQCQIGALNAVSTDFPTSFNYLGGSLTNDATGLVINAKTNGYVNVSLIASGLVYQDYGFYFLENNKMQLPKNIPLSFSQPISLLDSPNSYYTFNLTQPELMAVNYTNTINIGNVNFNVSQYDPTKQEYSPVIPVTTLNAEMGNLLNDSLGDLYQNPSGTNYNWLYFPAGDYKMEVTGAQNQNGQFEFTKVPVQSFSSGATNTTLNMNLNSLYAVQLPMNRGDFNFFNASTIAHDNVSVNYEYAIIGQYSFYGNNPDTVPFAHGNFILGNKEVNGQWVGYSSNETGPLQTYAYPTQTNFDPILLIRPYIATAYNNNNAQYYSANYSTTLTLSVTSGQNNHPFRNWRTVNPNPTYIGLGYGFQIPVSGAITGQKTVQINNDLVTQNNLMYVLALSTTPGQLYNLTITLNGNYSTGPGNLNATFYTSSGYVHVWVHSGNFNETTVFGDRYSTQTNTSAIFSLDFLAISSTSYLFSSIVRHLLDNATMNISLTSMAVKPLSLYNQAQTFSWNKTISSYELKDTKPLWNITNYHLGGGGLGILVPLAIVTGGVVIVAVAAGGFYYMRKKRTA